MTDASTHAPCRRRVLLLCSITLAASGCYTYEGVDGVRGVAPPAGARVELTERGAEHFRERTGRDENDPDGRVVRVADDSLYLAIEPSSGGSVGLAPVLDTVAIPFTHVNRISVKELSKTRTGLFLGGLTVGLGGYMIWAFDAAGGSGPGQGPEDGPDTSVIPALILTIPVP